MILDRIISGGQTGADRTGLEVAEELGIATGGMAPRRYRTETGEDWTLRDRFHLVESLSSSYPPRTEANVMMSDATVWFGDATSPGGRLTHRMCLKHHKRFINNPDSDTLREEILNADEPIRVLNVAGNRASTNPDVIRITRETLIGALIDGDYITEPDGTRGQ